MRLRRTQMAVAQLFLGLVIVLTAFRSHAAPPVDDSERDRCVRRSAEQIRQHIGKWLRPDSYIHDLMDEQLLFVFPKMRFPRKGAEVIVRERKGDLVITPNALNVGLGTILEVVGGDGSVTVEIIREKHGDLVGRIVPGERADSIRAWTRLHATDRRMRLSKWPPGKITSSVLESHGNHVRLYGTGSDSRNKEVLFSVYEAKDRLFTDGKFIGVAEILDTGGIGGRISLAHGFAPIKPLTKIYLEPRPWPLAPASRDDNGAEEEEESNDARRIRRTAEQIRRRIGKWLKPNSKLHDLPDLELTKLFPEIHYPKDGAEVTVLERSRWVVSTSAEPTIGLGAILVPVGDGGNGIYVEIVKTSPVRLIGDVIPSTRLESVPVGTRLRATDRRVGKVTWPPRRTTAVVKQVAKNRAALDCALKDARLKEVLFSVLAREGYKFVDFAEIVAIGDEVPDGNMLIEFENPSTRLEKDAEVYLVPCLSYAKLPEYDKDKKKPEGDER